MVTIRRTITLALFVVVALLLAACALDTDTTINSEADVAASSNEDEEAGPDHEDTEVGHSHDEEAGGHHEEEEAAHSHEDSDVAHGHDEQAGDHHEDEQAAHSHDDEHGSAPEPFDGAEEMRIVANEWEFEPASIHLHEGEAVNIVFVNEGTVEHEIELEAFDFHVHAEPGETVTAGFKPDQTGRFEFGCFIPGHYEAGMAGELVVEPPHS